MKITDFFDSSAKFHTENEVKEFIKNSKNFDSSKESTPDSDALIIFETSKQKTWLVTTKERLYCILDDNRTQTMNINWSISRNTLISDKEVKLNINTKDRNQAIGLVDIGDQHKDWLYSKSLFEDRDISIQIKSLIANKMVDI